MISHILIHTRHNGCMVQISVQCQASTNVKTNFLCAVCASSPSDELQCAYTLTELPSSLRQSCFPRHSNVPFAHWNILLQEESILLYLDVQLE